MIKITMRETKQTTSYYYPVYKRWELLKWGCNGQMIICDIKTPTYSPASLLSPIWDVTYVVYPYKHPRNKILRKIKLWLFKFAYSLNFIK